MPDAPLEDALAQAGRAKDEDAATEHRRLSVEQRLFGGEAPAPRNFGRFVELGRIGRGGMGEVFRAYDERLDRAVAIKLLHRGADDQDAQRLEREARALAKLSHPNVVQVYEVGKAAGRTFIAMELMRGRTLRVWAVAGTRTWRECVEVYRQAGLGLAAVHAKGLVHRDFKPDNAFIDDDDHVRVLDLGLVRQTDRPSEESVEPSDQEISLTRTGTIMGTPAYMSPEQLRGQEADARSDQFSYCVSLHEALYGCRPFEGRTLGALKQAVLGGEMRPRPRTSAVPVGVWTILVRGLAVDPDRRWPSMHALLAELRRRAAPRHRRRLVAAAAVGAGTLGLVLVPYATAESRCEGSELQLEGTWDDAREREVAAAIQRTELRYAADTWSRVRTSLDDYAQRWADHYTAVCEATRVTQVQTEEEMSLRMGCLHQHRSALRAVVDVLRDADDSRVENAVALVAGLPSLERCDDVERLRRQRQRVPPPEDPQVVRGVESLRDRLADVEATRRAGAYAEALTLVGPLVEQADALGYAPVQAEAMLLRGWLHSDDSRAAEAEQDLELAHELAAEHGHDAVTLESARALVYVVGYQGARYAEGLVWGRMALPLARHSGDPLTQARCWSALGTVFAGAGKYEQAEQHMRDALEVLEHTQGVDHPLVANGANSLGNVLQSRGDYAQSVQYHRRALGAWERTLGPDHPRVAMSLANLGIVLLRQGRHEQALEHHRRALQIRERVFGSDHPEIARSLNNLGTVLVAQGEYVQAERHHRRALEIQERSVGPDHPDLAYTVDDLGHALEGRGRYEDAEQAYRRALTIREHSLGAEHPLVAASTNNLGNALENLGRLDEAEQQFRRAVTLGEATWGPDHPNMAASVNNLGNVLLSQGKLDEAAGQFRRALDQQVRTLGPDHPQLAASLGNLASVLLRHGEYDQAEQRFGRALRIREAALGASHPLVAYSLIGLARVGLAQDRHHEARAHAERAVSIREGSEVAPDLLAEAEFVLARALWLDPTSRPRALALAERAEGIYARAGDAHAATLDEVGAWLERHR